MGQICARSNDFEEEEEEKEISTKTYFNSKKLLRVHMMLHCCDAKLFLKFAKIFCTKKITLKNVPLELMVQTSL